MWARKWAGYVEAEDFMSLGECQFELLTLHW